MILIFFYRFRCLINTLTEVILLTFYFFVAQVFFFCRPDSLIENSTDTDFIKFKSKVKYFPYHFVVFFIILNDFTKNEVLKSVFVKIIVLTILDMKWWNQHINRNNNHSLSSYSLIRFARIFVLVCKKFPLEQFSLNILLLEPSISN